MWVVPLCGQNIYIFCDRTVHYPLRHQKIELCPKSVQQHLYILSFIYKVLIPQSNSASCPELCLQGLGEVHCFQNLRRGTICPSQIEVRHMVARRCDCTPQSQRTVKGLHLARNLSMEKSMVQELLSVKQTRREGMGTMGYSAERRKGEENGKRKNTNTGPDRWCGGGGKKQHSSQTRK